MKVRVEWHCITLRACIHKSLNIWHYYRLTQTETLNNNYGYPHAVVPLLASGYSTVAGIIVDAYICSVAEGFSSSLRSCKCYIVN